MTQQNASAGAGGHDRRLQLVLRPRDLIGGLKPEYVIDRFPVTIGRHPTNDIELPFEAISRYHARIELQNGRPRLIDLCSSNGTFVNGDGVETAALDDQDTVSFGGVEFVVVFQARIFGDDEEEPPTPEPDASSVHFIMDADASQTIYHEELPESAATLAPLHGELTDVEQFKRARQQLETLYQLQEVLHSAGEEREMLHRALELLFRVLPVDRAVVLTRDPDDPSLFKPSVIKTKPDLGRTRIGISRTILQRCLREKVAILSRDAPLDERFDQSESIVLHNMRSVLCVPLGTGRQIFGFFHLDTMEAVRAFTEDDLRFMVNFAGAVSTNLHNLRMMREKIATERYAAVGQTITGMAHNIKNILVLTHGGIEMMESRLKRKKYDALEETWEVVRRGLARINGMVQDMLDYTRARNVEKRRVDVNELLRELHTTFADQFASRNVECRLELDERCVPVMLDQGGLEKAMNNLIVNALEALEDQGGEGARLRLATRVNRLGNIVIEVEDNGVGIPSEVLPRIFVPFFTTKGSRGSGLGLAMTKKFIEDMGGHLDVRSTEGVGTCFRITLQVVPPSPRLDDGDVSEEETEQVRRIEE